MIRHKLLILTIIPFLLTGCFITTKNQMPSPTLAEICSAWDIIRPSRTDSEETLRQIRDNKKVRRKVCVQ